LHILVAPHEVFCRSASQIEDRARERTLTCSSTPHPTRVALPYTHTIRSPIHTIHSPTQLGSPTTQHPRHSPNMHASLTPHPPDPYSAPAHGSHPTYTSAGLPLFFKAAGLDDEASLGTTKERAMFVLASLLFGRGVAETSLLTVQSACFFLPPSLSCPLFVPSSPESFLLLPSLAWFASSLQTAAPTVNTQRITPTPTQRHALARLSGGATHHCQHQRQQARPSAVEVVDLQPRPRQVSGELAIYPSIHPSTHPSIHPHPTHIPPIPSI
jgi:hypothetical protein